MSDEVLDAHVHQATGMIAAMTGSDIAGALERLRERASILGQTLEETALDVLDRVIRFDP